MNRQLVKDMEHMYLVFGLNDIDENEYVLQMALRGRMPSLLPLSIFAADGKSVLRADVTGCTSIKARYQTVQLRGSEIRKILSAISDTVRRLPAFLLDPGDLCLDPECIFLGPDDEILLCYIPHLSEEEPDSIRILAEYFLKKLDHSDLTAADLSYGLFDRVSSDTYILPDVLQRLLSSASPANTPVQGAVRSESGIKGGRESGPVQGSIRSGKEIKRGRGGSPAQETVLYGRNKSHRLGESPQKGRPGRRYRNKAGRWRKCIPAVLILAVSALVIVLFHMDLTQIGGMGFLSAALIWLTYSTLEKRNTEIHNVWADDEDPGDDAFYQSLLKKVYAEDAPAPGQWTDEGGNPGQPAGGQEMANAEAGGLAGAFLLSLQKERCPDIALTAPHMILGKSRGKADVVLPDDAVSRVHARIEQRTDGLYVCDLYSTNGTFLDGRRLESGREQPLKDGSVLSMGALRFKVHT